MRLFHSEILPNALGQVYVKYSFIYSKISIFVKLIFLTKHPKIKQNLFALKWVNTAVVCDGTHKTVQAAARQNHGVEMEAGHQIHQLAQGFLSFDNSLE